nr:zinc finger, CCHC-type [Tanacetum cinerariifolium]GFA82063.1 zinc finger, CCHC-type [Tanacetum cinerariifolium]
MKHMASNFAKLDKFEGVDFRRWQKKMHFLLSSMSVVYVLTTHIPDDGGDDLTVKQVRKRANHLRIEESLRVQDSDKPKSNNVANPSVFNMVEHNNSFRYNDNKGAIVHVCKDICWFKTYESLNDGSILISFLHMGNESTALMHGRGCVDLRLNIVNDNIGSAFMSTSKRNDSILWHARLGHVHFKMMQDMPNDGLIPAFDMKTEK